MNIRVIMGGIKMNIGKELRDVQDLMYGIHDALEDKDNYKVYELAKQLQKTSEEIQRKVNK